MHRPEAFNGGIRQRLDRLMVADVGRYGQRLDAHCLDPVSGACQCRFFHIRENNIKAIPREALGESKPNPARRACDDGHLSSIKFHGPILSP